MAAEPVWLHERIIEVIHLRQLAEHGGAEGVRDRSLLATALAEPLQLHSYGEPPPDLPALAASYAHGIAHLRPFVDGNKRTSFVAALLLLHVNGQDIRASPEERYATWLALATGDLDEAELAEWLRARLTLVD